MAAGIVTVVMQCQKAMAPQREIEEGRRRRSRSETLEEERACQIDKRRMEREGETSPPPSPTNVKSTPISDTPKQQHYRGGVALCTIITTLRLKLLFLVPCK